AASAGCRGTARSTLAASPRISNAVPLQSTVLLFLFISVGARHDQPSLRRREYQMPCQGDRGGIGGV
ncbi:hypothetical protein, partial [Microseira wollei]|uniref:hypothetical protein n=1 Tax=Microseira wollei TaxID=467598 RepID=UPI001CFC6347